MSTQAALGAAALDRKDYQSAIKHYTSAISELPTSPDYYIKRSTAYHRSSPPADDEALRDAERATYYAHKRGKKELIATAQMRRGIALFGLRRWVDAEKCFLWSQKKNEKEPGLGIWRKKLEVERMKSKDDDHHHHDGTVIEIPEPHPEASFRLTQALRSEDNGVGNDGSNTPTIPTSQTPANKIRHDWYQTSDTVVVTLLARGVPKDQTSIDIQERSVSISFPMLTGSTYDFSLDPLFAPIDALESKSTVLSTKIELVLKKVTPRQKWPTLESKESVVAQKIMTSEAVESSDVANQTVQTAHKPTTTTTTTTMITPSQSTAPSYPTSSRSGPKDWDKLAEELTKKPRSKKASSGNTTTTTSTNTTTIGQAVGVHTHEEAINNNNNNNDDNENGHDLLDEEADDDDDGGDPANSFFKKLYAGADADTRRAMIKSYQESNGTALSTNWAEVGVKKVDTTPPDGMEARSWS